MSKISVLLLEDIQGLGRTGDIVLVNDGYARNSLFPEGKAAAATPIVQKKHAAKKAKSKRDKEQELLKLQERAQILDGTELTLMAKVKEGIDIFGSITKKHIINELNTKASLSLKPGQINAPVPIKQIGSYDVAVYLSPEVECVVKLSVVADPSSVTEPQDDE